MPERGAASVTLDTIIANALLPVLSDRVEGSEPTSADYARAQFGAEAVTDALLADGGITHIAVERQRQVAAEGWTAAHDDGHRDGELAAAAACYAKVASRPREITDRVVGPLRRQGFDVEWPWDLEWWKPSTDPIRNLEKAGALIAAEIDRLLRVEAS